MRKKLICLLLAGALALGLCACAPGGEAPSPGQTPSPAVETDGALPAQSGQTPQPIETAAPGEALSLPPVPIDPPTAEYDLPDRDCQPWQTAYMDFLTALLQAEQDVQGGEEAFGGLAVDGGGIRLLPDEWPNIWNAMEMGSESYSLYDVDEDGVPELFVRYGNCEAAYTTQCYAYRDGQIWCIGEFHTGHSSLYTWPGKDSFLVSYGQMGYAEMYEYAMEDGKLAEGVLIFQEEDVWEYTEPDEIVPGAEYIEAFYTRRGMEDDFDWTGQPPYSLGEALLLPICDYYDGPAATGSSSEQARTAILAALSGETELYGASGDHFYGGVGWTAWEEYIQPGAAYPYNNQPLEIKAHVWQDMNGDGQEECILQLGEPERADDAASRSRYMVVLSEQDGTVYAYFFGFYDSAVFYADGTILNYGTDHRLSFWKGQCYYYSAQRAPSASPVKWLDSSPVG